MKQTPSFSGTHWVENQQQLLDQAPEARRHFVEENSSTEGSSMWPHRSFMGDLSKVPKSTNYTSFADHWFERVASGSQWMKGEEPEGREIPLPKFVEGDPTVCKGSAQVLPPWPVSASMGYDQFDARSISSMGYDPDISKVLPQWPDSASIGSGIQQTPSEKQARHARRETGGRVWSRFVFQISTQQIKEFELVPKLIGFKGKNMKLISNSCQAKLRIRGQGSKYKDFRGANGMMEATMPLQLCVSCPTQAQLDEASNMVRSLLDHHAQKFIKHCQDHGRSEPAAFYVECPGRVSV